MTITWAPPERLGHRGRARLPDVLADADADRDAVELEDRRLGARLEVALLVEDAVVRQVHLAVDGHDLAVREHGRRVVDVLGALREAHQGDDALRLRGELVERVARRRRGSPSSGAGPRADSRCSVSSGNTTSAAPPSRAALVHSAMRRALPAMSPTVGLIWASATRSSCCSRGIAPLSRLGCTILADRPSTAKGELFAPRPHQHARPRHRRLAAASTRRSATSAAAGSSSRAPTTSTSACRRRRHARADRQRGAGRALRPRHGYGHIALVGRGSRRPAGVARGAGHRAGEAAVPSRRPEEFRICFVADPDGYRIELIDGEFETPQDPDR